MPETDESATPSSRQPLADRALADVSLPRGLRLRRRQAPRAAADYRSAPERAELLIERRFHHGGHVVGAVCIVVSACIVAGFWWQRVEVARGFVNGTTVQFVLGAALLVVLAGWLVRRFARRETVTVSQDGLVVRGGGRAREVAARDVVQLYVRHLEEPPYGYEVVARLAGDETVVLVHDLDLAAQGRFVERQIEELLELENEPVEDELPEGMDPQRLPDRSPVPLVLGSVGLVVGTTILMFSAHGCSIPVGELPISTTGDETTLLVDLDRDQSVRVTAYVSLGGRYVATHSINQRSAEDLPETLRVDIAIEHEGEREMVSCDPLDVFSTNKDDAGATTWTLAGPVRNCRLDLRAGVTTLRARLAGETGDDFVLHTLTLNLSR